MKPLSSRTVTPNDDHSEEQRIRFQRLKRCLDAGEPLEQKISARCSLVNWEARFAKGLPVTGVNRRPLQGRFFSRSLPGIPLPIEALERKGSINLKIVRKILRVLPVDNDEKFCSMPLSFWRLILAHFGSILLGRHDQHSSSKLESPS